MLILSGLVVGFLLGVAVHRGDFCMHAALRELVARRPGRNVGAYLLALGVQLLVVNALFGLGLLSIPIPPVAVVGAALGGLTFGAGMVLAKGCATSLWSRIGTGSVGATVAAVGFAVGAAVITRVPLSWFDVTSVRIPPSLALVFGVSPWVVIVVALALLALALARRVAAPAEGPHWRWTTTGLLLGGLGVLAWLMGVPAGWHWGLSMTGPARSLTALIAGDVNAANWGSMMLIGVPLGTWFSARRQGPVGWRRVSWGDAARRGLGGFLMGAGGILAAGCNIGNALTGLSILAVNSVIATGAIVAGGVAAVLAETGVARLREVVNVPRVPDRRSP